MAHLKGKRKYAILSVMVASVAGFFFGLCYLDTPGVVPRPTFEPVAEARLFVEEKKLPSIRRLLAAQIAVFESRDYEEAEQCLQGLKAAGVNTIIVRAFQNEGDRLYGFARPQHQTGVYFQTSHAPVVDPVMAKIVSMGHRQGLKVYAWMETRNMPLELPDPKASKARRYSFETGSLEPMEMWSIFSAAVQKKLIGLFEDVVRSGIDGILFQDDLVMYQYEDFSARAAALFEKETGKVLDPERLYRKVFLDREGRGLVSHYSDTFWLWARWKNEKLLALADKLIGAAKGVDPETEIAVNFVYESVSDPKNALAWLSQSLTEATKLPIDYYSVMAYHRQMQKELSLTEEAVYDKISFMTATLLDLIDDSHKILMKIQMSDWDTQKQIPSFEADEIFQRINAQGRVSLAFFPYSSQIPMGLIGYHFRQGSDGMPPTQ
ncbi:MAG: poly-beta-1,6-N-acetyl-D-glucosamine N-deacetylase PgaB [Thermodesulfobacteriota bacterium]|nr:poly-beta-1,6-N-acetyl-D-glucosamine N-deacetylase PgaB [Thermodesulfobacteriota bacterium]